MNIPAFIIAVIALVLCIMGIVGNFDLYLRTHQNKHLTWIVILVLCIISNSYIIISNLLKLL